MPGPLVTSALVLIAYGLGAICMGVVLASRKGVDLLLHGSGNVGATNVGRVMGARAGRITLAWDVAKGMAPTLAARLLFPAAPRLLALVGVAAVLGHCFPVFHRFRGGKGVATAAGVLLVAAPLAAGLAILAFGIAKRLSHHASVGSLSATLVALSTVVLISPREIVGMTGALAGLIVIRHADNIRRLRRGTELPS